MPESRGLVIFPGSFDPFTLGHLDIVERAAKLFERVEVAIGVNESKKGLLPADARKRLISTAVRHMENVSVATFEGLVSKYASARGAVALIRGLRQPGDFEYEARMAHANGRLAGGLDTVFVAASPEFALISSTVVRDIYRWGGDVSAFVPPAVHEELEKLRAA